jgi:hypothetical protein
MNEEQIIKTFEEVIANENLFSFDDYFYPSREFMEQLFGGKRVKYDPSFVMDESERAGYIAKFSDGTLEIYVPDHMINKDVVLDNFEDMISDEYRYLIKKVVVGDGIKDMSKCFFEKFQSIESVYLGKDVEFVSPDTFYGNFSLSEITVSELNEHFISYNNVVFSHDMRKLVIYAPGKPEKFYEIPNHVETIGRSAFIGTGNLESVKIGSNVTTIEEAAFFDNWVRHIYIDKSVTMLKPYIFGSHDELQIYRADSWLVVGGEENSEVAHWCEKYDVNFYSLVDDAVDNFLAVPLPDTKNDEYQIVAYAECERKRKLKEEARRLHNEKVAQRYTGSFADLPF